MKPELATKMVEARAVLNALAITTYEELEIKRWKELESIARSALRLLRKGGDHEWTMEEVPRVRSPGGHN